MNREFPYKSYVTGQVGDAVWAMNDRIWKRLNSVPIVHALDVIRSRDYDDLDIAFEPIIVKLSVQEFQR